MMALVTGGMGMIGSSVARRLAEVGRAVRTADIRNPTSADDLRSVENCRKVMRGCTSVFHLADYVAGVGHSSTHHAEMFATSLNLSSNIIESAVREESVSELLLASSSCVYPDHLDFPAGENAGFEGEPESANRGYGWAKRVMELQARYYAELFPKTRIVIARPANVYGPSYDWTRADAQLHVIPALIRKMLHSDDPLTVWGDGEQVRTFQYERDTARRIVDLSRDGKSGEPYNLGGWPVKIRTVVDMLAHACCYRGRIVYTSGPVGPRDKRQDTAKLLELLGDRLSPEIGLQDGLAETVAAARNAWT
jgi:nucleoside-diphosphate-sugar epimerase